MKNYKKLWLEFRKWIKENHVPWQGGPAWRYWDGMENAYLSVRKKTEELEKKEQEQRKKKTSVE